MYQLSRGMIAEPLLVRKVEEKKSDEIIPCIRCFHCLDYGRFDELSCSVNPTVGRETKNLCQLAPAAQKKRIVIIGGGPAGMQAAITAKKRGHEVILLEKGAMLGGTLRIFDDVSFKQDLVKFRNYQIVMTKKAGVDVRLNTEATPQLVKDLRPDVVIFAGGGAPKLPKIKGVGFAHVLTAQEAIAHFHFAAGF